MDFSKLNLKCLQDKDKPYKYKLFTRGSFSHRYKERYR